MSNKNSRKKVDMKEVKCYSCKKFGHYAIDCYQNKDSREKDKE